MRSLTRSQREKVSFSSTFFPNSLDSISLFVNATEVLKRKEFSSHAIFTSLENKKNKHPSNQVFNNISRHGPHASSILNIHVYVNRPCNKKSVEFCRVMVRPLLQTRK